MTNPYTTQFFLTFLINIPADKWSANCGSVFMDQGRFNALGHCGETVQFGRTKMSNALRKLFRQFRLRVSQINDQPTQMFPQITPKARIVAALRYMVAVENNTLNAHYTTQAKERYLKLKAAGKKAAATRRANKLKIEQIHEILDAPPKFNQKLNDLIQTELRLV